MFHLCTSSKIQSKENGSLKGCTFLGGFSAKIVLEVVNNMQKCVPLACHSFHPIDWELNTLKRALGCVTEYLWWWLQPINFDGCCLMGKKTLLLCFSATVVCTQNLGKICFSGFHDELIFLFSNQNDQLHFWRWIRKRFVSFLSSWILRFCETPPLYCASPGDNKVRSIRQSCLCNLECKQHV